MLAEWSQSSPAVERLHRVTSPLLSKLRAIGTEHLYVDSGDVEELRPVLSRRPGTVLAEVDGNTVNQPLVRRVIERYAADPAFTRHAQRERSALRRGAPPGPASKEIAHPLYAAICARIGNDVVRAFSGGRAWEPSLQLHMGAVRDRAAAVALGHALRALVPSCLVKVPFLPHAPVSLLIARDLERDGVPVNFTSTFSARQAVLAALLTGAARTNVFMGRLGQGLGSEPVGEHVTLEAQRALRRLRRETGVGTRLIVASMRRWESFVRLAGCDAFTAPPAVLAGFLEHAELGRGDLASRLDTSYEDRIDLPPRALGLGSERIARLWRVEAELVEFLLDYGVSHEYADLDDPDVLVRRCDDAGFGDLFYAPSRSEWTTLRRGKLPDLGSDLARRLALDTHYSLLADGDFDSEQDAIDAELAGRIARAA